MPEGALQISEPRQSYHTLFSLNCTCRRGKCVVGVRTHQPDCSRHEHQDDRQHRGRINLRRPSTVDADPAAIQHAYGPLIRRYHPDAGVGSSAKKFRDVTEAYDFLIDPRRQRVIRTSVD